MPRKPGRRPFFAEPPPTPIERDERALRAQTRRDFLLFGLGALATAAGAWWLLPNRTKARLLPGEAGKRLDTLAARSGLSGTRRERVLDRALTFDDDVAEALYARDRRVRTYDPAQAIVPRNNYHGRTPTGAYLPGWTLTLSGLASGRKETLTLADLTRLLPRADQVTRLVCVEGWSAVAAWGGFPSARLLEAFPPAATARWAALRSEVNLDAHGNPDPFYVSMDLASLRHPQALFATHLAGAPLTLEHGAPLRLVAPFKLGLKNIKAVTHLEYTALEPPDYWNERGYSKYDGL